MAKKNIVLTISYIGIGYHGLQEVISRLKNKNSDQQENYVHNQSINENKEEENENIQENITTETPKEQSNETPKPITKESLKNQINEKQVASSNEIQETFSNEIQENQEIVTIETHIIQALLELKSITLLNSQDPKKLHLQRMCRTDKGVSASLNIILVRVNTIPDLSELNTVLSKISKNRIKILGIHNVSFKYRIKHKADKRIYEYLLPLKIFNKENINNFKDAFSINNNQLLNLNIYDDDEIESLKVKFYAIMQNFIGTKNHHNFTARANPAGKQRTIDSIDITIHNRTYLRIKIIGTAFMLHQIRKMIGFSILVFLTGKEDLFEKVFDENTTFNIPKVPGNFLFLNKPIINFINAKRKKENRDAIEIPEEIIKERTEIICNEIIREETAGLESFKIWFETCVKYSFEFDYIK